MSILNVVGLEDDALFMVVIKYHDLYIEADANGRVFHLVATGGRAAMPAGVRVGQSQEQVAHQLGLSPDIDEFEEVVWSPPVCGDHVSVDVNFTWTPVAGRFEANQPLEVTLKLSRIEMVRHDR